MDHWATGGYEAGCDVWSIGCIVYVMLAGAYPFEHNEVGLRSRKVQHMSRHMSGHRSVHMLGGAYPFEHSSMSTRNNINHVSIDMCVYAHVMLVRCLLLRAQRCRPPIAKDQHMSVHMSKRVVYTHGHVQVYTHVYAHVYTHVYGQVNESMYKLKYDDSLEPPISVCIDACAVMCTDISSDIHLQTCREHVSSRQRAFCSEPSVASLL